MSPRSVVVVGAGQAGSQAAVSLREAGFDGQVTVIGQERRPPYHRPPLSKSHLLGRTGPDDLDIRPTAGYRSLDIALRLGDPVSTIDPVRRLVCTAAGRRVPYDRLVLALGARPRRLRVPGADLPGVRYLRTADDADAIRRELRRAFRVVVVGGGFIGMELAGVMRGAGHEVTVVEAQPRVLERALSAETARHLTTAHQQAGTRIEVGATVSRIVGGGGRASGVLLVGGTRIPADVVLVGIGAVPDVELAARAGLAVEDGVVVDECLRTTDPAISAIGDCARYPSVHAEGDLVRVESVQNAVDQGRHVAADICAGPRPYTALPWFWSDQLSVKVQIAGISTGYDRAVPVGDPARGTFSVLCFRRQVLAAVEAVNRPRDYVAARRLLGLGARTTYAQLSCRGFDLRPPSPVA